MTTPDEMTAVLLEGAGGPEVLKAGRRPLPQPEQGEILIEVAAAGVNRPDVLQRQGAYPPPPGAPDWPGLEVSGTVVAVGEGASRFTIGSHVMALLPGGGYAEYATVSETNALAVPDGLSLIDAAGFPETAFTVWHNVFQRGRLQTGETFLVHGGTSGIGTTAIQFAKSFGATVFATAGSAEKCREAEALGADLCINYRDADFVEAIRKATDDHGIDLTLDMVGGPYTSRNVDVAAEDGRIVQIAFLKGAKVELDLNKVMRKRLTLSGSTLRNRSVAFKAGIAAELSERVLPLLASGQVKTVVDSTFALNEAADAHRRMEVDHVGKILLLTK